MIARLLDILSYARPHGSKAERKFLRRLLTERYDAIPIGPKDIPNYAIEVGPPSQTKTLFSCHTDTVHRQGKRQNPRHDKEMGMIFAPKGEPLGADNGAGIFVLLAMIDAKIPGFYVFHRGEECGGIGSHWIADNDPNLLKQFNRAIAFDRRDNHSVITHQRGRRCCSDTFAQALAEQLSPKHELDDGGSFTDTASYMDIIPECTNVSVGYMFEHTADEYLDVEYVCWLAERATKVDWEALPTVRDPSTREYDTKRDSIWTYHGEADVTGGNSFSGNVTTLIDMARRQRGNWDFKYTHYDDVLDLVYRNPEGAADILFHCLFNLEQELVEAEEEYEARLEESEEEKERVAEEDRLTDGDVEDIASSDEIGADEGSSDLASVAAEVATTSHNPEGV